MGRQHGSSNSAHWIWLGLVRNHSKTLDFYWADGSSATYRNWRYGCPDSREGEDCVLLTVFREKSSHWCNFKCDSNFDHVICQRLITDGPLSEEKVVTESSLIPFHTSWIWSDPFIVPEIGSTTPTPLSKRTFPPDQRPQIYNRTDVCPGGWAYNKDKCYKFFEETMTKEQAVYKCHFNGGNIVTVRNDEEQMFIVEYAYYLNEASEAFWLGAQRIGPNQDDFAWQDGSHLNYTNWSDHEPDNRNQSEYCVVVNDIAKYFGQWLDSPCSQMYHVVCEQKANFPESTTAARIQPPVNLEQNFQVKESQNGSTIFLIFLVIALSVTVTVLLSILYRLNTNLNQRSDEGNINFARLYNDGISLGQENQEESPYSEPNFP